MDTAEISRIFRANLRRLVDASGLTQREVAARAEFTERWLRKLLAGQQQPSIATLAGLCVALAVAPHELFAPRA